MPLLFSRLNSCVAAQRGAGVIGGKWLRNAIATPIMGTCSAYVAMRIKCHNFHNFCKIELLAMNYIIMWVSGLFLLYNNNIPNYIYIFSLPTAILGIFRVYLKLKNQF